MMAYKNHGGTAPESTKKVLDKITTTLAQQKKIVEADTKRVQAGWDSCRTIAGEISKAKSHDEYCKIVQKHRPKSLTK